MVLQKENSLALIIKKIEENHFLNGIINLFDKPKDLNGLWVDEEVDFILMNKDVWEGDVPSPILFKGHKYFGRLDDGTARIDNSHFFKHYDKGIICSDPDLIIKTLLNYLHTKQENGCRLYKIKAGTEVDIITTALNKYSRKNIVPYKKNGQNYLGVLITKSECSVKNCPDYVSYQFGHYCCNEKVIEKHLRKNGRI